LRVKGWWEKESWFCNAFRIDLALENGDGKERGVGGRKWIGIYRCRLRNSKGDTYPMRS